MCSISGFIADRRLAGETAERLCAALLWYGAERGDQSAGVYANRTLVKRAKAPKEFIRLPEFRGVFHKRTRFALCHTRWPTSGGRGDAQAQPFQTGTTVTVHNGHVFQSEEVAKEWGLVKPSGVDSEVLGSFVDTYGATMLPELLSTIFGSFAIATMWRGKLYLIRDRNPISTVTLTVGERTRLLVFGSTAEIVLSALKNIYLLPSHLNAVSIQEECLFEARPEGVVRISDPPTRSFRGRTYTPPRQGGVHGWCRGVSGVWNNGVFTPDRKEDGSSTGSTNDYLADRVLGSHCSIPGTPNLDRALAKYSEAERKGELPFD